MNNCPHINAVFGWSHTEYLGSCPDCGEEVTEEDVEFGARELLKDHVEGEVLEDQLREVATQ
jgi:transcription initiation factor IIE alpha subunit